jgi:hypothetical protein
MFGLDEIDRVLIRTSLYVAGEFLNVCNKYTVLELVSSHECSTQVVELCSPSLLTQAINRILRGIRRDFLPQKGKALELAMINVDSLYIYVIWDQVHGLR